MPTAQTFRGLGRLLLPDGTAGWTEYEVTITTIDAAGKTRAEGFISQGEVAWRARASGKPATLILNDGRKAKVRVLSHGGDYGRYAVEYRALPYRRLVNAT